MDLTFTEAEEAFRHEIRSWLEHHVPAKPLRSMDTADGFEQHRDWERVLHSDRWSVVSWPEKYGGRNCTLIEWLIFEEEYYRSGAPGRVSANGVTLLGPTIFGFGTEEQRDRFLPKMASGEEIWAQGWSEPDAGSDLAGIRSRARQVEGGWVLDGQKTWCSRAVFADWIAVLCRSDPAAPRHRGLTYFLTPLDAPGIEVRPIAQLDGEPGFADVFFDDVFVCDDHVLGAPNEGWSVAMATASSERSLSLRSPGRFLATADRLVHTWRDAGPGVDPSLDDAVVRGWLDADAYRRATFATVSGVADGGHIGPEASANKVFWSELDLDLHETALALAGTRAELTSAAPDSVDHARWLDGWLFSLAGPIYAGTNEIQRDVIADRVLGLPRNR